MYVIATKEDDINLILFVLRPINAEHIKNRLLNKFNAQKDSEYARVVNKITFILFNAGRNLNDIYEKFFAEEYDNINKFLEYEEGLKDELIKEINDKMKAGESIWQVKVSDYEGYNFVNLFDINYWEDDNIISILNEALEEQNNEN